MPFRVECTAGVQKGESYPLDPSKGNILGRSPSNGIYIRDKNVSRAHCQIRIEKGETLVEDLGSTNGTFVNGRRIMEIAVNPGDIIRLGLNEFRLVSYEEDESLTDTTTLLDGS